MPVVRPLGEPGASSIRVYTCDVCGFGYSDDGVTQADLDSYYADLAKYGDLALYSADDERGALTAEAPWELERARSLAEYIGGALSTEASILDVGCSTGTLVALLGEAGYARVVGVDPLASAVRVARETRGLDVRQGWIGSLEGVGLGDAIILSHVLEHVLDLADSLTSIRRYLAPDGKVIIEVPDASRYAKFVHSPYQDFNTEHINHFSPSMLTRLMANHGFREERLQQVMIKSGPAHPYPAIRGTWSVDGRPGGNRVVADPPDDLHDALVDYARVSESLFRKIDEQILVETNGEDFALWGAGQLTMKLLARDRFPRKRLRVIIDSAPTRKGKILSGMTVRGPGDLAPGEWPAVVVAGSVFASASISETLHSLDLPARVIALG